MLVYWRVFASTPQQSEEYNFVDVVPPLDGSVPFRAQLTERWVGGFGPGDSREVPGTVEVREDWSKGKGIGFLYSNKVFLKKKTYPFS